MTREDTYTKQDKKKMDPPVGTSANIPPAANPTMEDLLREMQQSNLRLPPTGIMCPRGTKVPRGLLRQTVLSGRIEE